MSLRNFRPKLPHWLGVAACLVMAGVGIWKWPGKKAPLATPAPHIAPPAPDAPWKQALWQQVLVPEAALLRREEHLLRDASFLAPLNQVLNEKYLELGHAPESEPEKAAFLKDLRESYRTATQSTEGLKLLAKLVERRFSTPAITVDQETQSVTADYGVLPGPLSWTPENGYTLTASPHLDESRHPQSPLVAGMLEALVKQHAGAREIVVRLCPLQDRQQRFYEYRYLRKSEVGHPGTGILTVSPAKDKSSPFYTEWSHWIRHDRFDRWSKQDYKLHQSLREQAEHPLSGALLEMDAQLALVIHAKDTAGAPVWRQDSLELAIQNQGHGWVSSYFEQVPRLLPQTWQGEPLAVWPASQVESRNLVAKVDAWKAAVREGQSGETSVRARDGTRYEWRPATAGTSSQTELVRVHADGQAEVLLHGGAGRHYLALSPDEAWLAFVDNGQGVLVYWLGGGGGRERE